MAAGLQLGVDQLAVHAHLEATSIRRHEGKRFDIRLKLLKQFGCQTGSPIQVMSNRTVDQFNSQQHRSSPSLSKNSAGDTTGFKEPVSLAGVRTRTTVRSIILSN